MTLVLKVLTHKIEGQPSKRGVVWVPRYTHYTYSCPCIVFDIYIYIYMYVCHTNTNNSPHTQWCFMFKHQILVTSFFSFRVAECILACLHTNVCVIVYTYLYEYYI